MSGKYEPENIEKDAKTGDVEIMDLIPLLAMCCCIFSCFLEFPDCFGAVCKNTFGCCSYTLMTCKASKEESACCRIISCDCDIVPCRICCKMQTQLCCMDLRASIPCLDDMPCLCTLLCCTCFYKFKPTCSCCSDVRTIDKKVFSRVKALEEEAQEELEEEEAERKRMKARRKWRQATDPETKRIYFVNEVTGETQWETPEGW